MAIKKFQNTIIIFAAILLLINLPVFCSGVAVSPTALKYDNILRDNPAQKEFIIFNTDPEEKQYNLYVKGTAADNRSGWFSFEPASPVSVDAKKGGVSGRKTVKVIVNPPADTPNGVYEDVLYVEERVNETSGGGMGGIILPGVGIRITTVVTDNESILLDVTDIYALSNKSGNPVRFMVMCSNRGNVKVQPNINIRIFRDGKYVDAVDYLAGHIIPGENKEVAVPWDTKNLELGAYSADVAVSLKGKVLKNKTTAFSILEKEYTKEDTVAPQESLRIVSVDAPAMIDLGETVRVNVVVKNTGAVDLNVKVNGKFYVESGETFVFENASFVAKSRVETIGLEFKPEKPGKYTLDGVVIYGSREIEIEQKLIAVLGEGEGFPITNVLLLALIALAVIIIALLLRKKGNK